MPFSALICLMRPQHWIKNLLVFAPLIFSGNLTSPPLLLATCAGFVSFSFTASAVYVINDLNDAERDSKHPTKSARPLASGEVTRTQALGLVALLLVATLALCPIARFSPLAHAILMAYLVSNLGYSLGLKNIPVLDIAILSSGYLLRVAFGGAVVGVMVSDWLYLTVLSGSLYLVLGKRRSEKARVGVEARPSLLAYRENDLSRAMTACSTLTTAFFALWARESTTPHAIWCVPLVLALFFRYSLDLSDEASGDPIETLFSDRMLQLLAGLLVISLVALRYLG